MNKIDEKTLQIIGGIMFMGCILLCLLFIIIRANRTQYSYLKGETSGISKECYVSEKSGCMCKIDGNFVPVDSYYEVDK